MHSRAWDRSRKDGKQTVKTNEVLMINDSFQMQGTKEKKDIKKRNRIRLGDYLYKKRIFTKNEMKKLNLSKLVWIKTKNKKNTKLLQFIREIIIVIFKCISKRFFKTFFFVLVDFRWWTWTAFDSFIKISLRPKQRKNTRIRLKAD